jgi:hypothetical protein
MIKTEMSAGDTPETEFSVVDYQGDAVDASKLENYYIEEIK